MRSEVLDLLTSSILLAVIAIGCWSDLRFRRIPNWLTVGGLCLALALRSFGGLESLGGVVLTSAGALVLTLPLFIFRALGGGDVKFLVAVAAFMTPVEMMQVMALSAVAGGVLAIGVAVYRGTFIPLVLDAGQLALSLATFGRRGSRRDLSTPEASATVIPYGVAISIGALTAWYL